MPPQIEYLVVIKPAPVKAPVGIGQSGYTISHNSGIRIKTVHAESAQEAADKAGVKGGETAMVCSAEHMQMFTRPELAPLIEAS